MTPQIARHINIVLFLNISLKNGGELLLKKSSNLSPFSCRQSKHPRSNTNGNGRDDTCTYQAKPPLGEKCLEEQELIVKEFYGRVIDSFGKENLIHLLHQMKELETVMTREIEQMEENGELED